MGSSAEPFATAEDLQSRWRQLSSAEAARAEVLLADASVYLRGVCSRSGADCGALADELRIVCCDLVQRKMSAPDGNPLRSVQQSGGPYSATLTYATPTRKFRLWPEDYELLGIRPGGKARQVPVAIHSGGGEVVWP